ncbi:non-ribosomal peptide synthase [Nostoc calcicola FACHB-389]|nr:non-ribosomal peptide synthase [Nostoc calcicola FACHB-3891]OKH36081.1 non-ribosomal peptide synthase [Nostoc calcicola FACHB-389]
MNVSELVENLTQQGVHLWVDNEKLKIRSPKGVITPEIQEKIVAYKAEIVAFLHDIDVATDLETVPLSQGLNLQTIGRLIGGFAEQSSVEYKPPIIDPKIMAQKLIVTFKPLSSSYNNQEILIFRQELKEKLRDYGVKILSWEEAIAEFNYDLILPVINKKRNFKFKGIKSEVNAIIDVEIPPSFIRKIGIIIAELVYLIYSSLILSERKLPVIKIARLSSWAEDYAAKYVDNPSKTQVIVITNIDHDFINPVIPYKQKINIGLNTLIRTFSEIVIGVSSDKISILNMNLSDSIFTRNEISNFVLKSLIPKVFVPIAPLLLSRFEIEQYNPQESIYAAKLVTLGQELASTGLFPPGFKLDEVIKRKSHRDIVSIIINGRTGVSYGFVAYAEPPQYFGEPEITKNEWENLLTVKGFSSNEIRQNDQGRRYIRIKKAEEYVFRQIPDIWLVSSRSGSNKTDLSIADDIIRIGLKEKLYLQLPKIIRSELVDMKPSYDIYVMLAISLSAALYTPELIKNGAPIVHFHGYPAFDWFKPNEYCVGVDNPSVPCGTYESGVFNFLGISSLANQQASNISLVSLIEPDHGANFIAHDLEYLVQRLQDGCKHGQIELGGKHFASLKSKI